jgi:integrase
MARKRRRRGNGLGSIRKRGTQYQIIWRDHGRRRFDHAPDMDTALKMLAVRASDLALGRVGVEPAKPDAPCLDKLVGPWIEGRKLDGHRSWDDDEGRWRLHLAPRFGKLRPDELDQQAIDSAVRAWRAANLSPATCRLLVRLLSSLYTHLCGRKLAKSNPAKGLPEETRRLIRPSHDPRLTPYLEQLSDVERIYRLLPEPTALAFAIGSMAGLRVGELLALRWANVDLERKRITVSEQVQGGVVLPPKDKDSRTVPIMDSLLPVLQAAKLASGGAVQVLRPMRGGSRKWFDPHTMHKHLRAALTAAGLVKLTWYQATRHTFASHWVKAGNSLDKLREAMGHSSVTTTERYSHLRGDIYSAAELGRVVVDFSAPVGKILPLTPAGAIGVTMTPESETAQAVEMASVT